MHLFYKLDTFAGGAGITAPPSGAAAPAQPNPSPAQFTPVPAQLQPCLSPSSNPSPSPSLNPSPTLTQPSPAPSQAHPGGLLVPTPRCSPFTKTPIFLCQNTHRSAGLKLFGFGGFPPIRRNVCFSDIQDKVLNQLRSLSLSVSQVRMQERHPVLGCISGHCCCKLTEGDLARLIGFHRAFSRGSFRQPLLKGLQM